MKPTSLYLLTIATSGAGKDTADTLASYALRDWQRHEHTRYQSAVRARKEAGQDAGDLVAPYRLCSDLTIEGLRRSYAHGAASQAVFSTEGGVILGGHGFSQEHRLKTAATLCSLWDRGHLSVLRAGEGRTERYGLRLSVHVAIQPEAVTEALFDPLLAGIGLWPRFLLAWPPDPKPRVLSPWRADSDPDVGAFWRRCNELLALPVPTDCTDLPVMTLDPEAREAIGSLFENAEHWAARGGDLEDIRPFALRAAEHTGRIAAVLATWAGKGSIGRDEAGCGVVLASHSIMQWQSVLLDGHADPDLTKALALYRWLAARPGAEATLTAIIQTAPRALRSRGARDAAIERLHAVGLIEVTGTVIRAKGISA